MNWALAAGLITLLVAVSNPSAASSGSALAVHLEGGLGGTAVSGLSTAGGFVGAGIGTPIRHAGLAVLDFGASAGREHGVYIPEGPRPGTRSLTTLLLGLEATDTGRTCGPFGSLGLGIGHVTLSDALGSWADSPNNKIQPRNDWGFAVGVGAGYRSSGGPGPLRMQLAFRTHTLLKAGEGPAVASAITLGFAY